MSLVGRVAPKYVAPAVVKGNIVENFSLDDYLGENYIVLFFYVADFSSVCRSELLSFQQLLPEFKKRKAQVIGISTDSVLSHYQWLQMPQEDGGIKGVEFPLVSDQSLLISSNYGVLAGNYAQNDDGQLVFMGEPVAYRASFVIDKEGVVRHQSVYDVFLGRNTHELLRVLDAMLCFAQKGKKCPPNWKVEEA